MAVGDTILIAKESSVQLAITSTNNVKTDTDTLKTLLADGATYVDNFPTTAVEAANLVASLSGKYELLGLLLAGTGYFSIQIDGNTNRKFLPAIPSANINLPAQFINLLGMGIKCNTSMVIRCSVAGSSAVYRELP